MYVCTYGSVVIAYVIGSPVVFKSENILRVEHYVELTCYSQDFLGSQYIPYSTLGRRHLVFRHSVPHTLANFRDTACTVAKLDAVRARKYKKNRVSSNLIHNHHDSCGFDIHSGKSIIIVSPRCKD